jgi:hypothetical protein
MHRPHLSWSDIVGRALVWAGLAAVYGGVWEVGQFPLYFHGYRPDAIGLISELLHSILVDAMIAVAGFFFVMLALRTADWPRLHARNGSALFTGIAMVLAGTVEWFRVYRFDGRDYSDAMPMIAGIGVTPLVQWLVLAPLIVLSIRELE